MAQKSKVPPRVSSQLPIIGLPGQNGNHIVVPVFPDDDPRNQGGPRGLSGEYEVTFTLSRPGYPLQPEKSVAGSDALEGDSHLGIPQIFRVAVSADGETFAFEGKPNSRGFLAALFVKCNVKGTGDAHDKCYKALTPMLSSISLKWDIPLTIYQVDVQEVRTGTRQFSNRNPFDEVNIKGQFVAAMDQEAKTYAAIYREAITTESVTYQFLCFYRIIESIQARRTRLERDARKQATSYIAPTEMYPGTEAEASNFLNSLFSQKASHSDPWTLDMILLPDAVGKEFRDIVTNYLKPVRDNIAHTSLQRASELISMDDPLSWQRVEMWLPPIKCIARKMLKNEFDSLFH